MRIATLNFYAGNKQPVKDLEFIKSFNADVIGMQEAHNRIDLIVKSLKGYDAFYPDEANFFKDKEAPVFLKKQGTEYLGDFSYVIAEAALPDKIAPRRWLTGVRWKQDGKQNVLLNCHLHAVVQNRTTGKPLKRGIKRIQEYIKSIKEIEEEINAQLRDGYNVIVCGDLNYRKYNVPGFRYWRYSPQKMFARTGLKYHQHGLDYVAWSSGLKKVSIRMIPKERTGSDHPWTIANFK